MSQDQRQLIENHIRNVFDRHKGNDTDLTIALKDLLQVFDIRGERLERAEQLSVKLEERLGEVADAINGEWRRIYGDGAEPPDPNEKQVLIMRIRNIAKDRDAWADNARLLQKGYNGLDQDLRHARLNMVGLVRELDVEKSANLKLQGLLKGLPQRIQNEELRRQFEIAVKEGVAEIFRQNIEERRGGSR